MGLFDSIGNIAGDVGNAAFLGIPGMVKGAVTNDFRASNPFSPTDFATALANQQQLYGQQQTLAQMLQAQAAGQGPNPALDQLHQTTQGNNMQAAGLISAQRGLNPALAARMATDRAAANNNAATGQAATLSAEEELGAQGQLGNLYGNMAGQQNQELATMTGGNNNANSVNAGVTNQNTENTTKLIGGLMQGAGSAAGKAAGFAQGGRVPGRAPVPGDSVKNDQVPAVLSPGEIVIPRSHTQNAKDAKDFVDELMKQSAKKKAKSGGFGAVLEAHRALGKALQAVNA